MTHVLTIIPLIHSWPAGRKSLESLSPLPVFSTSPTGGFKGHCLQVSMFVLWLCVSARPWLLYQTGDSGLSSSVLDQRPTISEAARLSQCLPNVCPCSGTENVDTVPKVPLQVPPPFVIACYHMLRFKNISVLRVCICFLFFFVSAEKISLRFHHTFFVTVQPDNRKYLRNIITHCTAQHWCNSLCMGDEEPQRLRNPFRFLLCAILLPTTKMSCPSFEPFWHLLLQNDCGLETKTAQYYWSVSFIYQGWQSVCMCASPFICLTVHLAYYCTSIYSFHRKMTLTFNQKPWKQIYTLLRWIHSTCICN